MDRTYNVFVDNGLFVLAHHLDKETKDIINADIVNSTSHFAKLFDKAYQSEKYRKLAFASFQNSAYTQSPTKEEGTKENKVIKQYNKILESLEKGETCTICGKDTVVNYDKDLISSISKSMFPRLSSNTFFNFSNNLKKLNICPICLYLGMLSFFNISVIGGQCVLFNSDDDEYMYDYTYEHSIKFNRDIITESKKEKEKYSQVIEQYIIDLINNNKIYNGYINMTLFYNSSQGESFNNDILTKKDIKFLKELQSLSLDSEFKLQGLFYQLLKDNLQKNYLSYVFDFKEDKLKISKELFQIIEERYSRLSEGKMNLIKRVSKEISEKLSKDIIKDLKGIDQLKQFEKMIMNWIDEIPNLMTSDEFNSLCNFREFSSIKNRMYVELINLKNEGER